MKPSSLVTICLLLGVAASAANGSPIAWSLSPVVLQGCCVPPLNEQQAIVSGSFLFDPLTEIYSDWRFDISGYTTPVEHLNSILTPATSTLMSGGSTFLHLSYGPNLGDLVLTFGYPTSFGVIEFPLSTFGGDVPATIANSSRLVSFAASSPAGVVSSVPEPVVGALVLVGAIVLCLWKPRRFHRSATRP